jgi:hypothetical protein
MEAGVRAIPTTEAATEPGEETGLFHALQDMAREFGGVELEIPPRDPARVVRGPDQQLVGPTG